MKMPKFEPKGKEIWESVVESINKPNAHWFFKYNPEKDLLKLLKEESKTNFIKKVEAKNKEIAQDDDVTNGVWEGAWAIINLHLALGVSDSDETQVAWKTLDDTDIKGLDDHLPPQKQLSRGTCADLTSGGKIVKIGTTIIKEITWT